MIEVKYNDRKLVVEGHANYGEQGKDIVCAGVSAITQGGATALQDHGSNYRVGDAYLEINLAKEPSNHDRIVLDTIISQIGLIARTYPKNVKVRQINEL